jgi:hypothetical protein
VSDSKPLLVDETALIAAWHGPNSTAEIASELNIRGSELDLAFRQLKREGKLPKQSRQTPASSDRPAADEDGSAALLEALIRAHGEDNETGERADLYPGSERKRR